MSPFLLPQLSQNDLTNFCQIDLEDRSCLFYLLGSMQNNDPQLFSKTCRGELLLEQEEEGNVIYALHRMLRSTIFKGIELYQIRFLIFQQVCQSQTFFPKSSNLRWEGLSRLRSLLLVLDTGLFRHIKERTRGSNSNFSKGFERTMTL